MNVKIRHRLLKIVLPMLVGMIVAYVPSALAASHSSQHNVNANHPLLVDTRTDVAFCVSSADRSDVGAVRSAIGQVAMAHKLWNPVFGSTPVRVDFGCPSEPYLSKFPNANTELVIPHVESASEYRVFIYVMPEAQRKALTGTDRRIWPQEALCDGDDCSTVTTGVLLTPAEVQDTDLLGAEILKALGLENPYPYTSPLPHQKMKKGPNKN